MQQSPYFEGYPLPAERKRKQRWLWAIAPAALLAATAIGFVGQHELRNDADWAPQALISGTPVATTPPAALPNTGTGGNANEQPNREERTK